MSKSNLSDINIKELNQQDIAKLLGVATSTVRNWESRGVEAEVGPFPAKGDDGYSWPAVLLWWTKYQALTTYKEALSPATETTLEAEKTRKEKALASMAELELAEKQGSLIEAKKVEREWQDIVLKIKSKIQNLPARISAVVNPLSTKSEIAASIEVEVSEALKELAEDR